MFLLAGWLSGLATRLRQQQTPPATRVCSIETTQNCLLHLKQTFESSPSMYLKEKEIQNTQKKTINKLSECQTVPDVIKYSQSFKKPTNVSYTLSFYCTILLSGVLDL